MFKIGDRVKCLKAYDGNHYIIGQEGTVILKEGRYIVVEFDEEVEGHDGRGEGEDLHCWEFYYDFWATTLMPLLEIGPPIPTSILVERKCKKLWNNSSFVMNNPKLAY